jgi:hypothetical protein
MNAAGLIYRLKQFVRDIFRFIISPGFWLCFPFLVVGPVVMGNAVTDAGSPSNYILIYSLLPLLIISIAAFWVIRYTKISLGFTGYWRAFRYLFAVLFNVWYPWIDIDDGQINPSQTHSLPLGHFMGPSIVTVQPGNVLVTEDLFGEIHTYGVGRIRINRFETIKDIIDLRDQHSSRSVISEFSNDGIRVNVRDLQFRYRLLGSREERTLASPYPHDRDTVIDMVYNRSNDGTGPTPWDMIIGFSVTGVIINYVNRHKIDDLTAPRSSNRNPRREIREALNDERVRVGLERNGAELIWVDIGHFEMPSEVSRQRTETWRARWAGEADVARVTGESKREAARRHGRAQAQAEILDGIIENLQALDFQGVKADRLRHIILIQIPHILDSLRERYQIES